jgi:hypothetical protein
MDKTMLAPGGKTTIVLELPPGLHFQGQRIINKGDSGLVISTVLIGQNSQLLREIPLQTQDCSLETCPAALSLMFYIRNDTTEHKKLWFEVRGRDAGRNTSPWRWGNK